MINTLLTYLELEGVLRATGPFYTEYKLAFSSSREEVVAHFDAERGAFLEALFATGRAGRSWLTLLPGEAAAELQVDRLRILNALWYLEQQGLVEMKVAGVRQGYRREDSTVMAEVLVPQLQSQFRQRERRDIARLHQVTEWAGSSSCYQQALVAYFGETLPAPCGQCSACLGGRQEMPARRTVAVDGGVIRQVQGESHAALASPRQLARFLCGITSPKASRARLGRHSAFGALAATPFAEVLASCRNDPG